MDPIIRHVGDHEIPTRKRLRSSAFVSPTRAVFMESAESRNLTSVCRAVQLALPANAVFSHLTSAALRKWRLPTVDHIPIIASTDAMAPHHNRRGVYVRRTAVPDVDRQVVSGVRISSAEWTIVELAEDLGLLDLVAVIDGALFAKECTTKSIERALVPGRRGAKTLRQALLMVDGRSESWWESILRQLYVLSGIAVEPQQAIFDAQGNFVARADLHILGTDRYPEYDGESHRDRSRHRRDLAREKGMSRIGKERFGYTAPEIIHSPELVLRDAEDALGLKPDPGRLIFWREEFEKSSMSKAGQRRLNQRLSRFERSSSPRGRN